VGLEQGLCVGGNSASAYVERLMSGEDDSKRHAGIIGLRPSRGRARLSSACGQRPLAATRSRCAQTSR